MNVFTVGYEGRTADEVIGLVAEAGVRRLLDVRYRPLSRKAGLSKNKLAAALASRGIEYRHDRDLGTPPEIMERVRNGKGYDASEWDDYRAFLSEQTQALDLAVDDATAAPTCLLCYEANPNECHRRLVADAIAERTGLRVVHLGSD